MNHYFYAISKAVPFLPLRMLMRATGQSVIMPFYHCVSDVRLPHIAHLYPVRTIKQFTADLDFYLSQYTPIGLQDIIAFLDYGKPLPRRAFFLSFDDGLREFKDIIAPILMQKGISATCFINSAFTDNQSLFFRFKASILTDFVVEANKTEHDQIAQILSDRGFNGSVHSSLLSVSYENRDILDQIAETIGVDFGSYLRTKQPYLSSEDIISLHADGFSFGAHSADHPLYCHLSLDEQVRQTAESASFLTELLGKTCQSFSFPFTDDRVNRSFFDRIFAEKEPIVSVSFAGAGLKNEPVKRHFQRIAIEAGQYSAQNIITGQYLYYMLKALLNKNTITR